MFIHQIRQKFVSYSTLHVMLWAVGLALHIYVIEQFIALYYWITSYLSQNIIHVITYIAILTFDKDLRTSAQDY